MTTWSLTFKVQPSEVRPLIKIYSVISILRYFTFSQSFFVWSFNRATEKITIVCSSKSLTFNSKSWRFGGGQYWRHYWFSTIFRQFSDNFSYRSAIMKAKKFRFSTSYISAMPSTISLKLQNMFIWSSFNTLHQYWTERKMENLVHLTFKTKIRNVSEEVLSLYHISEVITIKHFPYIMLLHSLLVEQLQLWASLHSTWPSDTTWEKTRKFRVVFVQLCDQ